MVWRLMDAQRRGARLQPSLQPTLAAGSDDLAEASRFMTDQTAQMRGQMRLTQFFQPASASAHQGNDR